MLRRALLLGLLVATTIPWSASAIPRCFRETSHCLDGRIQQYWEQNGGLPVFGFPIAGEANERNHDTGQTYTTQWMERNRFELHPTNSAPYDVLLGRLGNDRLRQLGVDWQTLPKAGSNTQHYFSQTGHAIGHAPFWRYWSTHGLDLGDPGISERESLALFGLPLSEPKMETNTSGDTALTQWFERARFEDHGSKGVLLGLLGSEVRGNSPGAPPPVIPPAPTVIGLEEVATRLDRPVFVTHAGDGSGRVFVAEQGGTIRTLPGGDLFLDIRDQVRAGGEQGLLGVAFHPRFRENGYLYVNYTDQQGNTVIARFTAAANRRTADPATEERVLYQRQPAANHNGGMLAFGPDGYLYIGLGDGGGSNDTYQNGQDRASLLGKLLRIDVDRGAPYVIPRDNPFVDAAGMRPEIWAYGLRNPWRFSFDRATGDLYIGDVGQNRFEWVHFQPAASRGGQNYGWPIVEGRACLRGTTCDRTGLTAPIAVYEHEPECAIVGGYVYRGARATALRGQYLFGDACSGRIWTLRREGDQWHMQERLQTKRYLSSFGEDEAGEVYVADLAGKVYRIIEQQP